MRQMRNTIFIYADDAACNYPQSGERIVGPDRLAYTVSIMELRDGKVVHETQYFADPFEAPAWRRQWVQPSAASTK